VSVVVFFFFEFLNEISFTNASNFIKDRKGYYVIIFWQIYDYGNRKN